MRAFAIDKYKDPLTLRDMPGPGEVVVAIAWMINNLAGTIIAQAVKAMEFGAASEHIAYTCHAHPTHAAALKKAAIVVGGKPIHI